MTNPSEPTTDPSTVTPTLAVKKGTGSERDNILPEDLIPARGACPLFQQAVTPTLAEELIEAVPDFFEKTGPVPNAWRDMRQYRRFHYRRTGRATIFAPRDPTQALWTDHVIVTCDLSRCGIAILLREQLFPGQHVELDLNSGPRQPAEVIWCHRTGKHFRAGCRFLPT